MCRSMITVENFGAKDAFSFPAAHMLLDHPILMRPGSFHFSPSFTTNLYIAMQSPACSVSKLTKHSLF